MAPRGTSQRFSGNSSAEESLASPGNQAEGVQSKGIGRNTSSLAPEGYRGPKFLGQTLPPRITSYHPFLFVPDATRVILLVKSFISSSVLLLKVLSGNSLSCPGNALELEWLLWCCCSKTTGKVRLLLRKPRFFFSLQLNSLVTGRRDMTDTFLMVYKEFFNSKPSTKRSSPPNCLLPKICKLVTPLFYQWFTICIQSIF